MSDAYLLAGARTPIGKFLGALKGLAAPELGSIVIRASLLRAGLHLREVDEVTDRMGAPIRLEQITNGGAIRVAARQRREILETQLTVRLFNRGQDDVGGVQAFSVGRASRRSSII